MENIETLGNPVVAVLSTSTLLVNVNTADIPVSTGTSEASFSASSETGAEEFARGSDGRADDVFVAYERLHASTPISSVPASRGDACTSCAPRRAQPAPGAHEADYSLGGGGCSGLLVTASSPHLEARDSDGKQTDATGVGSAGNESRGKTQSRPQSSSVPTQTALSLSDIAPLPLLVFDSETFSALGELNEGFFFQGGVAEWISRARPWGRRGDMSEIESSCSWSWHRRLNLSVRPIGANGEPLTLHGRDGDVCHMHKREWARQLVRARTATREEREQLRVDVGLVGELDTKTYFDDAGGRDSNAEPRISGTHNANSSGGQNGKRKKGVVHTEVLNERPGRQSNRRSASWELPEGGAAMDQWSRLPAAKLQALVQADADLFFLPLLLLQLSTGETKFTRADVFHSMGCHMLAASRNTTQCSKTHQRMEGKIEWFVTLPSYS